MRPSLSSILSRACDSPLFVQSSRHQLSRQSQWLLPKHLWHQMNEKDKKIAKRVCDQNLWLASIVASPHLCNNPRLLAAASSHLLHASSIFRVPKHACNSQGQQSSPKRRKLQHSQPCSAEAAAAADPAGQLQQAARAADVARLEQLCQQNSSLDANAAGPNGRTALHLAAEAGSAAAVRTLLGLGADTYCADDNGVSPLMLAAAGGHDAAVKVLLEAGADPFHVDYSGVNPLMCAARCGSAPCIQLLLAEGVDADFANTDLGAGEHALLLAAESGSVAAVLLLLAAGARLNRTEKEGRTALWAAARHGHALVVQLLLSRPNVKHICSFGALSTTPLEEAQAAHHTTCVALLSAHLQGQQQQQQQQVQAVQPSNAAAVDSRKFKQQQQHHHHHHHHLGTPSHQQQQARKHGPKSKKAPTQAFRAKVVPHQVEPLAAVVC